MKIEPVLFDLGKLPAFAPGHSAGRSSGAHVSEIIAYVMVRGGYSDKYRPGEWDQSGMVKAQLGFLWEHLIEQVVKDMFAVSCEGENPIRQIELKHDDIYGTPDCVVLDGVERPRIEEYKFTKKSLRKFLADVKLQDLTTSSYAWVLQIAAYMEMVTAAYQVKVRDCRLLPLFVNGDYSWKPPHGDTTPYPVNITLTDDEVAEYWGMIKSNRDALDREKAAGTWPPRR